MKLQKFNVNRAPMERFARIAMILNAATAPVPAHKIAAALEVSVKTVSRDLDFMRDRLELPVESHMGKSGGGYTFSKPVHLCPVCQMNHD